MSGSPITSDVAPDVKEVLARKRPNPRIAQMKRTWYFLRRNNLAMVGLGIIAFIVVVFAYSYFLNAPSTYLTQYCGTGSQTLSPISNNTGCVCTYASGATPPGPNCYAVPISAPSLVAPTFDLGHFNGGPLPLGSITVDPAGGYFYNIYQGLVKGTPWDLGISLSIVVAGAGIGIVLGSLAGYMGGYVEEVVMRATDIFLSIPGLFLVIVLEAVLSNDVTSLDGRIELLIGAFIVTWWPIYTRIVRSQVIVAREQKFVEAARASGARSGRIIGKHIIPNSLFPVFVQMSLDVGTIPLLIGTIVFLGFHLFPTPYFPEWGTLSALGVTSVESIFVQCQGASTCTFPWWQILFPSGMLFLFAISVNFLGDGLRDSLDPRLRR
jgi:peptide/nickel transport system permease protein